MRHRGKLLHYGILLTKPLRVSSWSRELLSGTATAAVISSWALWRCLLSAGDNRRTASSARCSVQRSITLMMPHNWTCIRTYVDESQFDRGANASLAIGFTWWESRWCITEGPTVMMAAPYYTACAATLPVALDRSGVSSDSAAVCWVYNISTTNRYASKW
jgi:hypothetical protein